MVMEAATLSSPQRKFNVVPVQKSLSLPSYARAGGEGIDHRLIFAALEQKEKVRRKSKIFAREKSSRQNIFCLPIPSSAKCRETSLSSDTSCSSLEYQKPKPLVKTKKEDAKIAKPSPKNDKPPNETVLPKTSQPELKSNNSDPLLKDVLARNAAIRDSELSFKICSDQRKGYRSPVDTMRLNVGSSDSMDRSSRSSNDSLSRKERLVAIKARVEAAREKYGESSSEEESRTTTSSSMTRYNSDGVIHRTVREVKSKSSRSERKLRRRSQDEWAVKKQANRKSNLSLCLHNENGNGKPVIGHHLSSRTEDDVNNLEIKTDFCPSPNVTDMLKKNYFSDYPSRENVSRFVQARIRHIEDEERKRRSGSDFRDIPTRQSPQLYEANSPVTTESKKRLGEYNGLHINTSEKTAFSDIQTRSSPIPRSSQAPTPPPRSPKSITFVNKAFIQHQNASLLHHDNSLERKRLPQQNAPTAFHSKLFDQFNSKSEAVIPDSKYPTDPFSEASEKQKIRELICSRRKTCGNFDFVDQNIFSDLSPLKSSPSSNSTSTNNNFSSLSQMKKHENKGYFSSSEMNCPPSEDPASKLWKSKWQENEQRREYMFNSLESKRKYNPPSWLKRKNTPSENDNCVPQLFPNSKLSSTSKSETNNIGTQQANADEFSTQLDCLNRLNSKEISSLSLHYPSDRLSKSEINIAFNEKSKPLPSDIKGDFPSSQTMQETSIKNTNSKSKSTDKTSATANLESAMEELESVYQSLKISSDNLSDKNNTSNSVDDKDTRKPKFSYYPVKDEFGFKRRSSVCETNLSSSFIKNDFQDFIKMSDIKKNVKSSPFAVSSDSVPVSKEKPPDQFSIDELFNDLTQQLDLEQKLLKEPRDNKLQPKICCQANRFPSPKPLNPQPSQISIRKEFYDNLSKGNLNQSKKYSSVNENNSIGEPQPALVKKKYKAVRSLSENISYLMTTANSNPASSKPALGLSNGHAEDNNSKTCAIEQYYERVRDPTKNDVKNDLSRKTPNSPTNTDKTVNQNQDEIRHIRVSMDANSFQSKPVIKDKFPSTKQYARLSSAVSSSQISSKHELIPKPFQEVPPSNPKETDDRLDETGVDQLISSLLGDDPVRGPPSSGLTKDPSPIRQEVPPPSCNSKESDVLEEGLEKLLNRLLGDVPDRQQSSLLQSKDLGPPTPPAGKLENVKINRSILPSKMDIYVAPNAKNKISNADCMLRSSEKSEESAQKNDFRQNNNGIVNQMSFIPVYTKKTTMCHNFPKSNPGDEKNKGDTVELQDSNKPRNKLHSPPVRQKCLIDQNEKLPGRTVNMYSRRRSVGFEDMTSMPSSYGYNLSNGRRFQLEQLNSNLSTGSVISKNRLNPERDLNFSYKKGKEQENGGNSVANQNTQIAENENTLVQKIVKPSEQLKDKSSKRKSSLNRIDFVDFPSACTGKIQQQRASYYLNSSSDEGSDSKSQQPNSEFLYSSSKRKHNTNQSFSKAPDVKLAEVPLPNSSSISKTREVMLPRALPSRTRHHKRIHSAAAHLQKFSHSAGELESLTDPSETASVSNKICLSAQEFDAQDSTAIGSKKSPSKGYLQLLQSAKTSQTTALVKNSSENASHIDASISRLIHSEDLSNSSANVSATVQNESVSPNSKILPAEKHVLDTAEEDGKNSILKGLDLNGSDLKHIDSRSEDESDLQQATSNIANLDICGEKDLENEPYISAEENCDPLGSDSERRPSSILRKKLFEEKKELHSILKPAPPAHEKQSRTPPSILKHRESSEEKDIWQQGDLHSILKKSTSEEESCNSGPDIRPILKVSTDEESPSGSMRPRPILKKRTSFSEECSYVSFPNGELKPILKKKTPLTMEEQPRPILKSRRKSEDARSSLSEFIASRPRAYSADMGVKSSHENRFDNLDLKKESFSKKEYHDL